jgi:4-amino-4-deoxy-L-arabinose transferase-like glycosyltransferase
MAKTVLFKDLFEHAKGGLVAQTPSDKRREEKEIHRLYHICCVLQEVFLVVAHNLLEQIFLLFGWRLNRRVGQKRAIPFSTLMPAAGMRLWPLLALMLLALALRCYGLTAPLLDYHSWRQADTAAIARNYAANGYRLLYPQVDWGGQTPGYIESEFPLYSYTLALLYGVFGVHTWLGRLLSALAGAAAVVALYGLARAGDGGREAIYSFASLRVSSRIGMLDRHFEGDGGRAIYAALALALMPFPIYFGRTLMPDMWMLLAAILALWTFRRWLDHPTFGHFGVALLCGALAPLAKTPNLLIVAVPLAYLVIVDWASKRPPMGRRICLLIYGLCFVLPSLLWMGHARTLPLDPRLSFGIGEKLFDTGLLLDPQFYLLLARWSIEHVITWAGLPFLILGLLPTTDHRPPTTGDDSSCHLVTLSSCQGFPFLPHFWLLGVLLFFLAGAAGVVGQDYYILPLAGPAAWLIGIGLARAQRALTWLVCSKTRDRPSSILYPLSSIVRFAPLIVLLAVAGLSLGHIAPLYRTADFYHSLGQRVDLALPAGARVGLIAPAVSEILYYSGRKGWRLDPGVIVPGGLASLSPDHGVRYLLIADPALTEGRAVLEAALHEYQRIPIGPYALLLDLARPGVRQPAQMVWETGHLVEDPFLSYWQAAGGVEQLGYPISDALDGQAGREQFFERALLRDTGDGVERLPVGRLLLEAHGHTPWPAEVAESFQAAWAQAGGERVLGTALSPAMDDGAGGQMQYFEFGVLESRREGLVGLGAAGRQLLEARNLTEERQIVLLRGW